MKPPEKHNSEAEACIGVLFGLIVFKGIGVLVSRRSEQDARIRKRGRRAAP